MEITVSLPGVATTGLGRAINNVPSRIKRGQLEVSCHGKFTVVLTGGHDSRKFESIAILDTFQDLKTGISNGYSIAHHIVAADIDPDDIKSCVLFEVEIDGVQHLLYGLLRQFYVEPAVNVIYIIGVPMLLNLGQHLARPALGCAISGQLDNYLE
jgi:hypothetical protein